MVQDNWPWQTDRKPNDANCPRRAITKTFYCPQSHLAQTFSLWQNHRDKISDKITVTKPLICGQFVGGQSIWLVIIRLKMQQSMKIEDPFNSTMENASSKFQNNLLIKKKIKQNGTIPPQWARVEGIWDWNLFHFKQNDFIAIVSREICFCFSSSDVTNLSCWNQWSNKTDPVILV